MDMDLICMLAKCPRATTKGNQAPSSRHTHIFACWYELNWCEVKPRLACAGHRLTRKPLQVWYLLDYSFDGKQHPHLCRKHARTKTDTQTHRHTDTQTHRHTDTQTHRHTDTQTHRHTDTQTHRHRHTDTDTQTHRHRDTQIQTHRHKHKHKRGHGDIQTYRHADTHTYTEHTDTQTQTHRHRHREHTQKQTHRSFAATQLAEPAENWQRRLTHQNLRPRRNGLCSRLRASSMVGTQRSQGNAIRFVTRRFASLRSTRKERVASIATSPLEKK